MKNIQKTISLLLFVCLMISMFPMRGSAEGTESMQQVTGIIYSKSEEPGSEELYEAYLNQVFYGGTSLFGTAAGERLTGDEKVLYDALVPILRQIADGQRSSAEITVGQPIDDSPVDSEAVFTCSEFTGDMLGRVVDALLADLPYACYWYDKTFGCGMSYFYGETVIQMTLYFTVAQNYRGVGEYSTDTTKTGAAKQAADNAKNIVSKYAADSDYDKLVGYKNEICALVSYDNAAADSGSFSVNDDPWQLISVFDGDDTTNVVCEGYSKAFMYLCDMTDFSGDVSCHTVSGYLDGGGHMWNIVDIAGKHYLADITNCENGTIGYDGSLFLAGGTGTSDGGYTVSGTRYIYSADMTELWGTGTNSLLTLEAENYDPDGGSGEHVHSYGEDNKCECGAIGGTCGENLTWTFDPESGLLTISGEGEMDQYYDKNQPWEEYNADIINVTIEEGVTSLSTYALFECEAMAQLNLPATLADIYENSLPTVGALTAINVAVDNLSYCTDNGVLYTKGMHALMKYPAHKTDTRYTIPDSIRVIAFNAFAGALNIDKLIFEGNAPFIDETSFEKTAFTIHYPANNPTWTSDMMQNYGGSITWKPYCVGEHTLVIVPAVEATCQATGLTDGVHCEVCGFVSRAQEIVPVVDHKYNAENICRFCGILGGNCGLEITNLKWTLSEDGVLIISGTGDMSNVDSSIYAPWNAHCDKITSVVVEEGVETIGKNMLGLLPNLRQVSLPETLRHIGAGAFHTNPKLEYIDFPGSLESISNSAFQNSGLKEVALPENAWIGAYAFENCTALKKVKIDSTLDTDSNGSYLFQGCTALTDVTLGENVKRIGQYMFAGCTSLKQITVPGNVKMLAGNAFDGCTGLTAVILANGVEHIGPSAFARCTALREFTFPASITELEEAIFNRCENLETLRFTGDAPNISGSAFSTLKVTAYYPADNNTWTKDARGYYGSTLIEWLPANHSHSYTATVVAPTCYDQGYTEYTCTCSYSYRDNFVKATGHHYSSDQDPYCSICGDVRSVPMFRMYDPNSSEHFYTGSEKEREILITKGWRYEGVGFNFPFIGSPVHRLYEPITGEHLYTMDEAEMDRLLASGWNYEGVAFNSAGTDEVPQFRLKNPNAKRGAYHFTGSPEERDHLISLGWRYQGIGWYSCLR